MSRKAAMMKGNQRIQEFIRSLYLFQSVDLLSASICRHLFDVIGCENVAVCTHDGQSRIIAGMVAVQPLHCGARMATANQQGITATNPFWDTVFDEKRPVCCLSDLVSQRAWHRNPFYCELFVHDRVEDHMKMEVSGSDSFFSTLNVLRSRRGFAPEESGYLMQCRPHILQAYRNAHLLESAGWVSDPAAMYWLVPINARGQLVVMAPMAVPHIPGHTEQVGQLPSAIRDWAVFQIQRIRMGEFDKEIAPLHLCGGKATWICTLYLGHDPELFMLSIRLVSAMCPPQLSHRESEILSWVSAGKGNEEIAIILNLSRNTIKTHLKHIFVKLGVENRTAAVVAWQQLRSRA